MKYKVRLVYAVEMVVEAESEDVVTEWLSCTTPQEAKDMAWHGVQEDYGEEILYKMQDDALVDYKIQ